MWASTSPTNVPAGTVLFDTAWLKVPAGVFNTASNDLEPEDWTLTRSLPVFQIAGDAASDNIYNFYAAAGIIVWEGIDDTPPNPLEVPYPVFDGDADWVWTSVVPSGLHFHNTGLLLADQPAVDLAFQSRAQRKLSSRQGLLLVIGIDNSLGLTPVSGMVWSWYSRHHFKLP